MRSPGEVIMDLVATGLTDEQKGLVLELAALATTCAVEPAKAAKAARNARYYQARKLRKATDKATERPLNKAAETTEYGLIQPALVRVEDNNLPLEIAGGHTAQQERAGAVVWPPSVPAVGAELDALEALLRSEGSPAINPTAPNICVLTPILNLAQPGTGPPCDLYADVLPVIRSRSKSAKPNSICSWAFFVKPILEARDRRLQDLPSVEQFPSRPHARPDQPSAKFAAKQANLARAFRGSEIAAAGRRGQW